ncbi:hypothetical protein TNCV_4372541 [Trichonephila clavipes]|nr:hypothetical protein TNCV_4372541 [Trichonephila clavipes]
MKKTVELVHSNTPNFRDRPSVKFPYDLLIGLDLDELIERHEQDIEEFESLTQVLQCLARCISMSIYCQLLIVGIKQFLDVIIIHF